MSPTLPDVDHTIAPGSVVVIGSVLTCLWECATPPHITARDTFYRPSPALVQQVTNTGVRRPGHEARCVEVLMIECGLVQSVSKPLQEFVL